MSVLPFGYGSRHILSECCCRVPPTSYAEPTIRYASRCTRDLTVTIPIANAALMIAEPWKIVLSPELLDTTRKGNLSSSNNDDGISASWDVQLFFPGRRHRTSSLSAAE